MQQEKDRIEEKLAKREAAKRKMDQHARRLGLTSTHLFGKSERRSSSQARPSASAKDGQEGELSEDFAKRLADVLQKVTDNSIKVVDELSAKKTVDIRAV